MRILLITVAGMSSRFSKSLGREVLKCIYRPSADTPVGDTLLGRMLLRDTKFDRYVIVGGYKFDELKAFIDENFTSLNEYIDLVRNDHFEDLGSGYSLFLGLVQALKYKPDEILFAEGDLFLDDDAFSKTASSDKNVITTCSEPILASRAVALYFDGEDKVRYIYDTGHNLLHIDEPFKSIYNSGQVWKFADRDIMEDVLSSMSEEDWKGTNLVFIEKYFRKAVPDSIKIVPFSFWVNCNTVKDYDYGRSL